MENGENYVKLVGTVVYPSLKEVGNRSALFKGKIRIPIHGSFQYVKIAAWGSLAEALNEVPSKEVVSVLGHIEERSYSSTCRHCGGPDKKFWTEVVVDNFIIINNEKG